MIIVEHHRAGPPSFMGGGADDDDDDDDDDNDDDDDLDPVAHPTGTNRIELEYVSAVMPSQISGQILST